MKTLAVMIAEGADGATIHLGVTSVMPNLGGLLIQLEDRNNIQIEEYELDEVEFVLRYVTDEECEGDVYEDYDENYITGYRKYCVVDHRH